MLKNQIYPSRSVDTNVNPIINDRGIVTFISGNDMIMSEERISNYCDLKSERGIFVI
jgi:hypothetical protein